MTSSDSDQKAFLFKRPLISVVMPVFNAGRFLEEAAQSILSQSIPDIELIAIDDGSTDQSKTVLDRIRRRDDRVKLISRENRGLVDSLNEGIDLARGEWIARMDQDDISLPHRFQRQLEWLQDSGADICGSWVQPFGRSDRRTMKYPQTDAAIKVGMLFASPFAHPTVMMRTEIARTLKYDKDWEKVEDFDLWVRAQASQCRMANVPEVLLHYRQHERQISTADHDRQNATAQVILNRVAAEFSSQWQIEPGILEQLIGLRGRDVQGVDMDSADQAAETLIEKTSGEAREVVADHLARLYFRAAGVHSRVAARWRNICRKSGHPPSVKIQTALWLAGALKIKVDSPLFNVLKVRYKGF
ncbi:MAG: glycosyltransferase [Rhodocyclaceae bacterium]|nr:glycosyltransferase [Rhodocyclaceae bacterium]